MPANEVIELRDYRQVESIDDAEVGTDELAPGTHLLNKQYCITGYLNSGGFGITYIAKDSLNRNVVIKECYPGFMCKRVGQEMHVRNQTDKQELDSIVELFVKEAHSLASLEHDNIVKVHQIFEQNNTAYMALDFINGYDLVDILDQHADALSPARIVSITRKLLPAIAFVHERGMLHRDVSPDNIIIAKSGEPMLIDFGAAHEQVNHATRSYAQLKFVKDGYSPQEFYIPGANQGPSSDLYSFAASMYYIVAGEPPIDAQSRLAAVAAGKSDPFAPLEGRFEGYPPNFLSAIDKAMNLMPESRYQSAQEWLLDISRKTKPRPARPSMPIAAEPSDPVETEANASAAPVAPSRPKVAKEERPKTQTAADAVSPAVAASLKAYADASLQEIEQSEAEAKLASLAKEAPLTEEKSKSAKLPIALATIAVGVAGIGYFQFVAPTGGETQTASISEPVAPVAEPQEIAAAQSQPALADPVVEQPVVEQPAVEQPVVEQPVVANTLPSVTALTEVVTAQAETPPAAVEESSATRSIATPQNTDTEVVAAADPAIEPASELVANSIVSFDFTAEFLALPTADASPSINVSSATFVASGSPAQAPSSAQVAETPFVVVAQSAPQVSAAETSMSQSLGPVSGDVLPSLDAENWIAPADLLVASLAPVGGTEFAVQADLTPPAALPAPSIRADVLDQQIAFSHWDIDMPFTVEMKQVRNATTATVTALESDADFDVVGGWLREGTIIYTFNGETFASGSSLSAQILTNLNIDPDGYARSSVRYRDPIGGKIDRGLLAVPVVREMGLADGTLLEGRLVDGAWAFSVTALGDQADTSLQVGDTLLAETTSGIALTHHDEMIKAFQRLTDRGAREASLQISRNGQVASIVLPLATTAQR